MHKLCMCRYVMEKKKRINQNIAQTKRGLESLEEDIKHYRRRRTVQESPKNVWFTFEGVLSRGAFAVYSLPMLGILVGSMGILTHPTLRWLAIICIFVSVWSLCALTSQRLLHLRKHSALMLFLFFPFVNVFFYIYLLFGYPKER